MLPQIPDRQVENGYGIAKGIYALYGVDVERATVDWALRLKPYDTVKRLALLHMIDSSDGRKISTWIGLDQGGRKSHPSSR